MISYKYLWLYTYMLKTFFYTQDNGQHPNQVCAHLDEGGGIHLRKMPKRLSLYL